MNKLTAPIVLAMCLSMSVQAGSPSVQMTFHVRDDVGENVTGATIAVSTFARWVQGPAFGHDEEEQVKGRTDTNGLVTIALSSKTGDVRYMLHADGPHSRTMDIGGTLYYRDMGASMRFTNSLDATWQPWNPVIDLEVRRVLNPIPMYARFLRSGRFLIPARDVEIGYDLMKSDWTEPYGNGEVADFVIKLDCILGGQRADGIQIFDATLTLAFSNDGDGIQEVEAPLSCGSVLRLPRIAPLSGYEASWVSRTYSTESEDCCPIKETQNFFYRVRTQKDAEGGITNAYYGKIAGPVFCEVRAHGASMQMKYYLNPTPNDRNLEFDPARNLFTNLPVAEQVREP